MERNAREARLALLAGRQSGAFSFGQALELGFSSSTIGRRLASRTWERRHAGVYVIGGTPRSRLQDLWVAVLAVGRQAVITHESAALIHGAERLPPHPITLTVPHGGHHALAGLFVHQIDDLAAAHRTNHRGLPVSTPARAVVELGATQRDTELGRVVDDLLNSRRTTLQSIAAVLHQVARPGKPGIERVARVLDQRGDGYVPPASELERSLFSTLAAGGLPPPDRQVPLPGRGDVAGLVDGAYGDAMMVLEADGRRWHTRVADLRRDRERDAQVIRAGWVPLRFVYDQIEHEPAKVCEIVAETRVHRLRYLGRAA